MESANGRLKTWKYLDKVLPNSQIPYIGDYVQIICAVINKYRPPISSGAYDDDLIVASKMRVLATESNILQTFVEENGNLDISSKYKKERANFHFIIFIIACHENKNKSTQSI